MVKDHIKFGEHLLYYQKAGEGKKILLAFHGFGQSATHYDSFIEKLGHVYTIYAFDIFFHGDSYYQHKEEALEKKELGKIILTLLEREGISHFDIAGYSMGGKFALACIELFPDRIKRALLIAPDGIKTSFWYSLATYPQFFRNIFYKIIKNPDIFWNITKTAKRLKIVDKSILKFAKSQMKTEEQRQRVYFTWVIFRHLKFQMKEIAEIINQRKIELWMITGEYDRIITTQNMQALLKYIDDYETVELPTGHNQLIEESAEYLAGKIN